MIVPHRVIFIYQEGSEILGALTIDGDTFYYFSVKLQLTRPARLTTFDDDVTFPPTLSSEIPVWDINSLVPKFVLRKEGDRWRLFPFEGKSIFNIPNIVKNLKEDSNEIYRRQ